MPNKQCKIISPFYPPQLYKFYELKKLYCQFEKMELKKKKSSRRCQHGESTKITKHFWNMAIDTLLGSWSPTVPNEFPARSSSFQRVPLNVPNCSRLYLISFALSSTLVTYISAQRSILQYIQKLIIIIFLIVNKAWLKFLMMGQSKMPITKEKQYESQYTTLPL